MQFSFEHGLERIPKKRKTTSARRRVFNAPCDCYELELTCPHRIKEKTVSIPDSIIQDTKDKTPEWQQYFSLERNANTKPYKAA